RMIAAAPTEQRMIGHMSGPPARTISHIPATPRPGNRPHHTGATGQCGPRRSRPRHGHLVKSAPSMPRSFLKKITPHPRKLQNHCFLRIFGSRVLHPGRWSLQRRAVTGAFAAGLAISFVPLPVHLFLGALVAIVWRLNIPTIALTLLVVNPITALPIYYT